MIKNSVINTYIIKEFLLSTFNVTLIISAAGLIWLQVSCLQHSDGFPSFGSMKEVGNRLQ